jgi:hypothetical protein
MNNPCLYTNCVTSLWNVELRHSNKLMFVKPVGYITFPPPQVWAPWDHLPFGPTITGLLPKGPSARDYQREHRHGTAIFFVYLSAFSTFLHIEILFNVLIHKI